MSVSKGIALITGSAQGIGRGIALRLARDGFDIALNDLPSKRDQLHAVADDIQKIGRKTHLVPADITIETEVKGMLQGVVKELGGVDVMVANAGVGEMTDLDTWERIMSVNARGTFLCYKYAAAQMIAQGRGGRIIGASSAVGRLGVPLGCAYSASKFAVRALTQSASLELGKHNITVNAYAPGFIETPLATALLADKKLASVDEELLQWLMNHLMRRPIKRNGQPEDIAGIVSYLASAEGQYVTGQCIAVDGGVTMS